MSCYFVAQIKIHNPEGYQKYLDGYDEVFARYLGQVVAVGDSPIVLEGTWPYTRFVIIRFPSPDEARRWYDSPEYQALAQHRWQASQADILLVKGQA